MGPRGRRMRRRGLMVGMAAGAAMSNRGGKDEPAPQAAAPAQSDMSVKLQELESLKQQGIITQEEFDAKKKQILGI